MRRRVGLHALVLALFLLLLGTSVSAAPQPGRVHFTAAGDFSSSGNANAVLNAINATDSDFTMAVGDLSYGTTGQEATWCKFVTDRVGTGYPFEVVSGNHESNGLNGNINDFSPCLPNQLPGAVGTYGRQYYVDVPAENPIVRFIMISPALTYPDGYWGYTAGSQRYLWTEQAIDGARTASIPWVVVGMHKPCITVGLYDCDPGPDLFNLLLSKKVDLILSGHEHNYQRSHQLRLGAGCTTLTPNVYNAACVADTDSNFTQGSGSVAMVVGTGGQTAYDVSSTDPEANYFAATSGLNKNSTFGVLDVNATADTLSASFVGASGGTFTDSFTIDRSQQPNNVPPVASFTAGCTNLSCSFDAGATTDSDGTIASYAWNFGDGTTGSGVSPTHAYATAGSYTVSLTATDDDGATGSAAKNVAPTNPPATGYASDSYSRTLASGWGSAPTGGAWTLTGAASNFTVGNGVGTIRNAAGAGPAATLAGVSALNTDQLVTFGLDKPATGGGIYLYSYGRRVTGQGSYFAKAKVGSAGEVTLALSRLTSAGAEVSVQAATTISGLTYSVGDQLNVRVQTTGSPTTTVRAKVWKVGTVEPAGWQRSATDTTAGMQAAGSVGVGSYLSSTANNAPITVLIDQFTTTAP